MSLIKTNIMRKYVPTPIKNICDKAKQFNIAAFLPHLWELLDKLHDKQVKERFNRSTGNKLCNKKHKIIAIRTKKFLEQLQAMFGNFFSIK